MKSENLEPVIRFSFPATTLPCYRHMAYYCSLNLSISYTTWVVIFVAKMVRPSTVSAIPLTRNISFRTNVSKNCEPNLMYIIWSLLQYHRHGNIKIWTNYQSQIIFSNKIKTFLMKTPLVSITFVLWTLKPLVKSSLKPCFLRDQVYLWKYWHSRESSLIQTAVTLVSCQIYYIITYFQ